MRPLFNPSDHTISLARVESWPATKHRFDDESIWAVRAALAARRPLLIRGEPGIGKSQLARAVATVLKVPFLYHVVHERCEVGDLLYSVDAVARLAQAQVAGALGKAGGEWQGALAEEKFIKPGVLWWALNWGDAERQAKAFFRTVKRHEPHPGWKPAEAGCVVLIDEIDKADTAVPNALLETLGNLGFQVPETGKSVALDTELAPPLVIITTNEERELPAAFLRRCFVLQMPFPPKGRSPEEFLCERARTHFTPAEVADDVCAEAARQLLADRAGALREGLSRPGAAEFLDLLRALVALHPGQADEQRRALAKIRDFALRKNPAEERV